MYHSDITVRDNGGVSEIWNIAITEYILVALFHFLVAAHSGVVEVVCLHPRAGGNVRGIIFPLPSGSRRGVDDIALLKIIHGNSFNHVASLMPKAGHLRFIGPGSSQPNVDAGISSV